MAAFARGRSTHKAGSYKKQRENEDRKPGWRHANAKNTANLKTLSCTTCKYMTMTTGGQVFSIRGGNDILFRLTPRAVFWCGLTDWRGQRKRQTGRRRRAERSPLNECAG